MKKTMVTIFIAIITLGLSGCSTLEEPKPSVDNNILGSKNYVFTKKYNYKKLMVRKMPYERYKTPGGTSGIAGIAVEGIASLVINKSREGEYFYKVFWKITNDKNQNFYLETQCEEEEECLQKMKDYVEDQL